ncbi:MAG: gamma-glutamyltransferase, partial [Phycisphaerae bacterium]
MSPTPRARLLPLLLVPFAAACATTHLTADWWADSAHHMAAADHAAASQAGAEILAAGGNAVDAAVAVGFALAVVRPQSCGLGGGGFMVIHRPGESPVVVDYREVAPAGAALAAYLDAEGKPIPGRTRYGGWAVGVPGEVKGLLYALQTFGSGRISRADVLGPAIRLAHRPLVVDAHLCDAMRSFARNVESHPAFARRFAALREHVLRNGRPYAIGDAIDRSEIAAVLNEIAERGAAGFYSGWVAQRIAQTVREVGGPLSTADLAAYVPRVITPLRGRFGPFEIITMPPPSSGGAVLLQVLNVLSGSDSELPDWNPARPADAHRIVEALKHAFADRARYLGDRSRDVMSDAARMITPRRAAQVRAAIDAEKTLPVDAYGIQATPDDSGTCHYCVVDADGMAVAATDTINTEFGSYLYVPGTGIILNNELDDFTVDSATPNAYGLRQSRRNLIRPGRRPLSSMSPTIVVRDGRVELVVGASGGPRIITATLQV